MAIIKSQVALVRFEQSPGFAGKPILWVKRVRFFKSKKACRVYEKGLYRRFPKHFSLVMGEIMTPFEMLTRNKKQWWSNDDFFQKFAVERQMELPSPEVIDSYIR